MARLMATALVIACALTVSTAQRVKIEPRLVAEERNGEWTWKLEASGEIAIAELIRLFAQARNLLVLYDPKKLAGVTAWDGNAQEITGTDIDLFVANALEEFRLVLAPMGSNQYHIIPAALAITQAKFIPVEDLDKANPATWAVTYFHCVNIDPNNLRGKLHAVANREGGIVNPYPGGGVLIGDRVDRIIKMLEIAKVIDAGEKSECRAHALPEGMDVEAAARTLRGLFDTDAKFMVAADGRRIVARVRPHQHDEVATAISSMK
jgi:hypothetical protein